MSRKTVMAKFENEVYDVNITGRNVLVTDPMKDYALEKISKVDKFNIHITDINVVMDIQKLIHKVDITAKIDHTFIKCTASTDTMYSAIDKATDRLQSQLRRYKGRLREHHLKHKPAIDMNVNVIEAPDELAIINDEIESETTTNLIDKYTPRKIVSTETRPLQVLKEDEAIMEMVLTGKLFLIYRSEETQKLKVIYLRNDNNYGVIEIEK
jgi:putative sigma-54 modulation protein